MFIQTKEGVSCLLKGIRRMKVLLIQNDLYNHIGGGQTVYQKMIESSPDIEFFYFLDREKSTHIRPVNAFGIELKGMRKLKIPNNPIFPAYKVDRLMQADRYAHSVCGMQFDIVDIPDYLDFGSYLKSALRYNNVRYQKLALAMHGNISKSIELGWEVDQINTMEIKENEYQQFQDADFVYSISPKYMAEWKSRLDRDIYYLDPMHFVSYQLQDYQDAKEKPSLYCIGRLERLKGNDLFIDIARWLNADSYKEAVHVGTDEVMPNGITASYHLGNIAKEKNMEHKFVKAMNREQLAGLFASKAVVILPVRYDTLNLVVLEALFSGCPTAVSKEAGVCEYLDTYFPQIPYCKIDFDHYAQSIQNIQYLLDHYDAEREKLKRSLQSISLNFNTRDEIHKMYDRCLKQRGNEQQMLYEYKPALSGAGLFLRMSARKLHLHKLKSVYAFGVKIKDIKGIRRKLAKRLLEKLLNIKNPALLLHTFNSMEFIDKQKYIASLPEQNLEQIGRKLEVLYGACANQIDRVTMYRELARLLQKTGDDSYALTYLLRVLRLKGCTNQEIEKIKELLASQNFGSKVQILDLFLQDNKEKYDSKNTYFYKQYKQRLAGTLEDDFEIFEESRAGDFKVSVIVSLYNAAEKLDFFLSMLSMQSMLLHRQAEIVFIDSQSPMDEKSVIDKYKGKFSYVYVRTNHRETIQCAWNRGIQLAKGNYLSFLGVDEMIYPETLDVLANVLDQEETVDWVMADSLVTKVNKQGIYEKSVMVYDRKNNNQNIVYLESCYLSYVGGMYRKEIHEKYGYYDAGFRGAGDTEFKNRILPYIHVKFIPKTYGIFLDYPEERVTASPMAEIEDLEAWYAHRTGPGAAYAMQNASQEDAQQLMLLALNYRKSYCSHMSSDIEYAYHVAKYIKARYRQPGMADKLEPILGRIVTGYQELEQLSDKQSKLAGVREVRKILKDMQQLKKTVRNLTGKELTLEIFNDNRYEQHSWTWTAPQKQRQ